MPVCADIIPTVFGNIDEQNPVVLELISSKAMQRLKHIEQFGPQPYFISNYPQLSRYEHSLGVYALLKRYNLSQQEQIAGLLHDASHTVFSHLGDLLYQEGNMRKESYQDSIHDWFLHKMHVDEILAKYNLSLRDVSPKNPKFVALDQEYPDMNTDRIEYNIHAALVLKDLQPSDIEPLLASLQYKDKKWYFTDIAQAKRFAKISTSYNKYFYGYASNAAFYTVAVAALRQAVKEKLITDDDLHFGLDQQVVDKLKASNNPIIKKLTAILRNIEKHYVVADQNNFDVFVPVKMRGIDPLVLQGTKMRRLSELSWDFNNDLKMTQQHANLGTYIKFVNIADPEIRKLLTS